MDKKQVATAIISLVIGGGSIWQFLDYRLQEAELEVETIRTTTALRKELNTLFLDIIELSQDYNRLIGGQQSTTRNDVNNLQRRLAVLKDDFRALEESLALLEGRTPREIELEFRSPRAPSGLKEVEP